MKTFVEELRWLINSHSMESGSNTSDWILADYLQKCLDAFDEAVLKREENRRASSVRFTPAMCLWRWSAAWNSWDPACRLSGSWLRNCFPKRPDVCPFCELRTEVRPR